MRKGSHALYDWKLLQPLEYFLGAGVVGISFGVAEAALDVDDSPSYLWVLGVDDFVLLASDVEVVCLGMLGRVLNEGMGTVGVKL
jgi:hypothetical protein